MTDHPSDRAHRGFLYQLAAKGSFVAAGYAVHVGLGRLLGPATYGIIGIILSVTGVLRILVMNGVRQAVSRLTATNSVAAAGDIRRKALQAQAVFVILVTLAYLGSVDLLSQWLGDSTLAPYLRIASLFIPLAGFYVIYISSLNGLRAFGKQALVIILYNVVRVIGSLSLVWIGFRLYGAVSGLLLAPLTALIVGWLACRNPVKPPDLEMDQIPFRGNSYLKDMFLFGVPMLFYAVGTSVLLNLDLFFVKRIVPDDAATGLYTAAMALSQSLFYVAQVFVEILFPSIGAISSRTGIEETTRYIRRWLRYAILLLFLGALMLSTSAREIIELYSGSYTSVALPLACLSWGMCFYALFIVITNVTAALGKPWVAAIFSIAFVPLSALLNSVLIPRLGLLGAAVATSSTMLIGTVSTMLWFFLFIGQSPIKTLTLVRVIATSLMLGIPLALFGSRLPLASRLLITGLAYLFVLIILGEINKNDWLNLRKILATRGLSTTLNRPAE
jgi:stage V sporulation protein B